MASPGGDYGHWVWTVWTVNESIRHGENPYFTPRTYYPIGAHLAKHTLVPGVFPLTFAVDVVTRHAPLYPVYAYRLAIGISLVLALALTFRLLCGLGFAWWFSLPIVIGYAFSAFTRTHAAHLNHVTAVALVPLSGIVLLAAYRHPTWRRLAALALVLGMGIYFTEMIVFVWLAVLLLALAAIIVRQSRQQVLEWLRRLRAGPLLVACLIFVLSVIPFSIQWNAAGARPPKESQKVAFSANAIGFVVSHPGDSLLYSSWTSRLHPLLWKRLGAAFLGYPLLACSLIGMIAAFGKGLAPDEAAWTKVAAIVAFSFLLLSLGPQLRVGLTATGLPLPYGLLMRVPPFSMGRTPLRLVLLALIFLSIVGAVGLRFLIARVRARSYAAGVAVLCVACFWSMADVYRREGVASPYTPPPALKALSPGPVINVPISFSDGFAAFLQVFHGQPIATGYISRRAPEHVEHVRELNALLERDAGEFGRTMFSRGFRNAILGPGARDDLSEILRRSGLTVVDLRDAPASLPQIDEEQ